MGACLRHLFCTESVALAFHPEKLRHTMTNVPALPAAVASAESLLRILPALRIRSHEATPSHMEYREINVAIGLTYECVEKLIHFTICCIDFVCKYPLDFALPEVVVQLSLPAQHAATIFKSGACLWGFDVIRICNYSCQSRPFSSIHSFSRS